MKNMFLVVAMFISSCASTNVKHENLGLVVEVGQSYRYDLNQGIYSVYYMRKHPTKIAFQLSNDEKKIITDKYYELTIDQLPGIAEIKGQCGMVPPTFTSLHFKNDHTIQEVRIEDGCDKFSQADIDKAQKINDFLATVFGIFNSKPEIKNGPKTDIPGK